MNQELQAFRAVDFNWTHALQSIWTDPDFQVDELHEAIIDQIMDDFRRETVNITDKPVGRVVLGQAGAGKTHLIGTLRRRVWQTGGWFVLLDIVGISNFWATTAYCFVNSLLQPMTNGRTQYRTLLVKIAKTVPLDSMAKSAIAEWEAKPDRTRLDFVELFLKILRRVDMAGATRHQDIIRAFLLLESEDMDVSNLAYCWLQGLDVDEPRRRELRFLTAPLAYPQLVEGMIWIMSLAGPILIAVDQIDAIVAASNALGGGVGAQDSESERKARHIIEILAGGLMDLHDLKRRAMTVVSCLQDTWRIIEHKAVKSALHRFEELPVLKSIGNRRIVENLIGGRLAKAYAAIGFHPPHRTWPFRPEAIDSAVGLLPREILIRCQKHRRRCIEEGEILECESLANLSADAPPPSPSFGLEQKFRDCLASADILALLDQENEDTAMSQLLVQACELLLGHVSLPDTMDAIVKPDPNPKKPSLHARLSFVFHDEGDREQHYCFRSLSHTNANAFQARLKAAMTASGIDTQLRFRHLFVLRRGDPPGGKVTTALVDQFAKAGGRFVEPTENDLRVFVALRTMANADLPGFEAWLLARRPLFATNLFKTAGLAPPPFLSGSAPPPPPPPAPSGSSSKLSPSPAMTRPAAPVRSVPEPSAVSPATRPPAPEPPRAPPFAEVTPDPQPPRAPLVIPIGRRFERGALGDPVVLAADLLPRHMAILAGSGSGKTVLLRRIVEEAALLEIPAIVLDINNDLSRLGDPWPTRPPEFSDEDAAKAAAYEARAEVVVWTPGVSSGNPLSLNLLPDFAAIGGGEDSQTEDDRASAVEMAQATLEPYLGGTGQKATLKRGVLADALRLFARSGGALDDLIGLLSELPEHASMIGDAPKLAGEIANQLLAAVATNPLLNRSGPSLDPKRLFYGESDKTRISVINLAGLASDAAKQSFVNQLQMALFTWIKPNPSPTGRLYVLDEAQNFAPSQVGTACKRSALSLAAQARKYGLGMIFATQLPKGIDNAIVSNCTTQVYGRMSAPATIQATQELMASKGGVAEDIGRLTRGEFYFSTEGFARPLKICTPLCLSWHPPNPPTAAEVLEKARGGMKSKLA
jgi:hypothetical protein